MKLKMKKTVKGSEDGIIIKTFEAGETYEVNDRLGNSFIDSGFADELKGKTKDVKEAPSGAPENAAKGKAPENAADKAPKKGAKSK